MNTTRSIRFGADQECYWIYEELPDGSLALLRPKTPFSHDIADRARRVMEHLLRRSEQPYTADAA